MFPFKFIYRYQVFINKIEITNNVVALNSRFLEIHEMENKFSLNVHRTKCLLPSIIQMIRYIIIKYFIEQIIKCLKEIVKNYIISNNIKCFEGNNYLLYIIKIFKKIIMASLHFKTYKLTRYQCSADSNNVVWPQTVNDKH